MTGTWRDTLFVWEGNLEHLKDPNKKTATDDNDKHQWIGSWVGCEDCPDARTAATPNQLAFQESDMQFAVSCDNVKVVINNNNNNNSHQHSSYYEMHSGSGWDLGEGEDKARHQDHRHEILCKNPLFPDDGKSSSSNGGAEPCSCELVVATGENDFGAFISVGYMTLCNQPHIDIVGSTSNTQRRPLLLARRYLDHGDVRAKWTTEELYNKIMAGSDPGLWKSNTTKTPNGQHYSRRLAAPWRTMDMHAKKVSAPRGGKRKRNEKATTTAVASEQLPELHIPLKRSETFSPDFEISTTGSLQTSHVRWLEQCQGCGKQVLANNDDNNSFDQACFLSVAGVKAGASALNENDGSQANSYIGLEKNHVTAYCTSVCAVQSGAKGWADAGEHWAKVQQQQKSGLNLMGNRHDSFWKAIESNGTAKETLIAKGWKVVDGMDPVLVPQGSSVGGP